MIWLHYVGRSDRFLVNALRQGATRRVAPQVAAQMSFGDRIILASWNKGDPYMFAEFTVSQVLLQNKTAREIMSQLRMCGMAEAAEGEPIRVVKECGEFTIASGCVVSCSMGEIVEAATYTAGLVGERPWFMVGGAITALYDNIPVDPVFKQVQGFAQIGTETRESGKSGEVPCALLEVQGYTTN